MGLEDRSPVRVVAYDPLGERRGVVPEWVELEVTDTLNAASTATVVVAADTLAASRLATPCEFAIERFDESTGTWVEPPNCRFLSISAERDLVSPAETIHVHGMGFALVLQWASVWSSTPGNEEGKRVFHAQSPGAMLQTLLSEAAARTDSAGRKWGKGKIAWSFTPEADSAGSKWGKNAAKTFSASATLAKPLDWLASKGAIDWRFQGRTLQVYRGGGAMARDESSSVLLRKVFSTAQPVTTSWEQLCTVAKFRGDGGYQKTKENPAASSVFGRVERWSEQGQVTRDATADLYLEELLRRGEAPVTQWRREWVAESGTPTLWYDYQVGDWVRVEAREKLRVVEAGVKVEADGTITGWETLGTRLESLLEKLARRTTDLSDGAVGADSGAPAPAGEDTRTPMPPTDVLATSDTIVTAEGHYRGVITVSWTRPTLATNRTEMTPVAYRVWAREEGSSQLRLEAQTGDVASVGIYGTPGRSYEVRVQAGSQAGRWSALSDPATIRVEDDVTPPPAPSRPVLAADLGVITITTDGLSGEGERMPPDFDHYEAHITTNRGEHEAAVAGEFPGASLVGLEGEKQWFFPAPTYGTWYVLLYAVDRAGNRSKPSKPAQIEVKSSVDTAAIKAEIDAALEDWRGEKATLEERLAALDKKNEALRGEIATQIEQAAKTAGKQVLWVEAKNAAAVKFPPDAPDGAVLFARERPGAPIWGMWVRDGQSWHSTPLEKAAIGGVDISKLVAKDGQVSQQVADAIWARKIAASKITTDEIIAGADFDSLLPLPLEHRRDYEWTGSWNVGSDNGIWISGKVSEAKFLTPWMLVKPGDDYMLSFSVFATKAPSNLQLIVYPIVKGEDPEMGIAVAQSVSLNRYLRAHQIGFTLESILPQATVAASKRGPREIRWAIVVDEPLPSGSQVVIRELQFCRAAGATRIAGGAITSDKIAANAVTAGAIKANAITADKIEAGAIQASHIAANAVTAKAIKSDAIDGMTITGALIQNSRSNTGLKISGGSIRGYDSLGQQSLYIDSAYAKWTAPKNQKNYLSISTSAYRERVTFSVYADLPGYEKKSGSIFIPTAGEIGKSGAYGQGTLVISGTERKLNSSGRAELKLGEGAFWYLGTVWGPANYQAYVQASSGPGIDPNRRHNPGELELYAGGALVLRSRDKKIQVPGIPSTSGGLNITIPARSSEWTLQYVGSARRFKTGIRDVKVDPAALLEVPVREWWDKSEMEAYANRLEDDAGAKTGRWAYAVKPRRVPGLVAEEVEAAGLENYVQYDEEGRTLALMYDRLWTLLIPLVKDLRDRVDQLEAQHASDREEGTDG